MMDDAANAGLIQTAVWGRLSLFGTSLKVLEISVAEFLDECDETEAL